MLLTRLLKTIDDSFFGDIVSGKEKLISNSNPDKIYVENIRSFFGFSFRIATFYCDLAVRAGYFSKHKGYICANKNCQKIILEKDFKETIPKELNCTNCEIREEENYLFDTNRLNQIVFYRLVKGPKNDK